MPTCFVLGCGNRHSKRKFGVSFHAFPKNLRTEWLMAINRDPEILVINQRVCSEHFRSEDLEQIGALRKVKPNVIPTQNLPHKQDFSLELEYNRLYDLPRVQDVAVDLDFTNVCRTCSLPGDLQPIFENDPLIDVDMLTEIVDIKIIKNDDFPQNICASCLEKLKEAYNFIKQCKETHKKFEECLKNQSNVPSTVEEFVDVDIDRKTVIKQEHLFLIHLEDDDTSDWNGYSSDSVLGLSKQENDTVNTGSGSSDGILGPSNEDLDSGTIKNKTPLKCGSCGRMFSERRNYLRHLRIHQGRSHVCTVCGRGFTARNVLLAHMSTHSTERAFKCELCDKTYKRQLQLKYHVTNNHCQDGIQNNVDMEKSFLCNHCGKTFLKKQPLDEHMRIHTGEKPYKCTICNKSFTHASMFSTHRKIHTGEKPYSCSYCDRTFRYKYAVKGHESIHTGKKPYKCGICELTFRQPTHLRRHKRMHTGEKPYSCKVCQRNFAENGNLRVHMRIHTGETPYVCSTCSKGFYDSSSLKRHVKKHV